MRDLRFKSDLEQTQLSQGSTVRLTLWERGVLTAALRDRLLTAWSRSEEDYSDTQKLLDKVRI